LQQLWQGMSTDSPNRSTLSPTVVLFGLARQSESELKALLRLVLGRAAAPAPVAA
jgi:hypothetical protein